MIPTESQVVEFIRTARYLKRGYTYDILGVRNMDIAYHFSCKVSDIVDMGIRNIPALRSGHNGRIHFLKDPYANANADAQDLDRPKKIKARVKRVVLD